jgi:sporulation protein YunB
MHLKRKYFNKRRNNAKKSFFVVLTILALIIMMFYYIVDKNLKPIIMVMSENKARLIATQAINEAAHKKIAQDDYKDLVTVMTDKDGKVTMLKIDPILMNKLATETTLAIQEELNNIESKSLKIPLVNILGSQLLANTGPSISVRIQPVGSVKVDYKSAVEAAGINMARHNIYLYVETNIRIIAPLIRNDVEVATHVPISETIIVGDVPESYINVPEGNNSNDYLNFIQTNDPFDGK